MVKRKERSVYTSKGGILTRVISTRLTKLAKYSKALSSSRFLPSLPLYFHHQSSTFAPLLTTTSFLFLLSVFFFFFIFPSLLCVYACVCLFFFHCLLRHTPIAYVWPEEASSFPFLGQPPTLKFLQSLVAVSTLVLCFSFAGFFRFTYVLLFSFLCLFLVWLGGRCRYLQRSWSEGILNVCGGNLRFDLFLSGDIFMIFIIDKSFFIVMFFFLVDGVCRDYFLNSLFLVYFFKL